MFEMHAVSPGHLIGQLHFSSLSANRFIDSCSYPKWGCVNRRPIMAKTDPPIPTLETADKLVACEKRVGYVFSDKKLLLSALTHASGADHRLRSNERLEFLGDAILGFVVCEELFQQFPELLEGELTKIKSSVVSRRTCAKISRQLGLDEFMILGKGMTGDQPVPASLYADVFEALLAGLYLDGGLDVARKFIRDHLLEEIEATANGETVVNFKSHLQQISQRHQGHPPIYLMIEETGPDHCKMFKVAAQIGKTVYSPAWGKNKKDAEQRAAGNALAEMEGALPPFSESESEVGETQPPAEHISSDAGK
jgi:ribonuclease-3